MDDGKDVIGSGVRDESIDNSVLNPLSLQVPKLQAPKVSTCSLLRRDDADVNVLDPISALKAVAILGKSVQQVLVIRKLLQEGQNVRCSRPIRSENLLQIGSGRRIYDQVVHYTFRDISVSVSGGWIQADRE